MHASETISLVYPEPLNLQDQKVSAMNFDWRNPCPIYFLNSSPKKKHPKTNRSKTKQTSKTDSPLFPSHQLFHLGDNNRERQALDDDRHEGCAICLLMSLCVSPPFLPASPSFPLFPEKFFALCAAAAAALCKGTVHF